MTNERTGAASDLSSVAELERQLAATLSETSQELARAECFDSEQRAEVYTILRTLMKDTDLHREWVGQWLRAQPGEAMNA